MDLERFYEECKLKLPEIEQFDPEDQKEMYATITSRATEHKQTLINRRKELLPLEREGNQELHQTALVDSEFPEVEGGNTPLYPAEKSHGATIVRNSFS